MSPFVRTTHVMQQHYVEPLVVITAVAVMAAVAAAAAAAVVAAVAAVTVAAKIPN